MTLLMIATYLWIYLIPFSSLVLVVTYWNVPPAVTHSVPAEQEVHGDTEGLAVSPLSASGLRGER